MSAHEKEAPIAASAAVEPAHAAKQQPAASVGLRARLVDLLSDSAVYGLSSMLGRVIGFLLLPLYTQYLNTSQYGVIAMLAIITLVFMRVANLGMTNAIFRRYNFCENDAERRAVLGTGLATVMASALVLLGITAAGATVIAESVVGDASTAPLVRLCLLSAAIAVIGAVPRIVLRAARRARTAAALNLVQVVFSVVPTIWFVVFAGLGVEGVLLGNLIGEAVTALVAFACTWGSFHLGIDVPNWKFMLRYGLPFVPHHVQGVLLALFGQYMVREMIGISEAGIYNVATRFVLPIGLVVNSVQTSWVPYKFQMVAENADAKSFFRSTLVYYTAGICYLWMGVSLWGPEVVRLMTQQSFHGAAILVWAVGLIPLTQGACFMISTGMELGNDTRQYPLITLIGLITVIGAAYTLIDYTGAFGAALATALGYAVMAVALYFLAQRRYAIHYDWPTLACLAAAAGLFVVLGYVTQSATLWVRISAALGMSLAYPIVAFLLLLRSRDERGRMTRLWHQFRNRLPAAAHQ